MGGQSVKGRQGRAEKRLAMQIDTRFPLNKLNELARMESFNKHYYRPPNYLHKWWARRLGSVFRTIILGTFLANLIFFSYKLRSLADANVYKLELNRIIHTSSKKLETAFIAGLIGPKMPPKEEFDRIVADKMIEFINSQK